MTSSQPNLQLRQASRHLSPVAVRLLNVLLADLTAAAFANSCVRSCDAARHLATRQQNDSCAPAQREGCTSESTPEGWCT